MATFKQLKHSRTKIKTEVAQLVEKTQAAMEIATYWLTEYLDGDSIVDIMHTKIGSEAIQYSLYIAVVFSCSACFQLLKQLFKQQTLTCVTRPKR